MLAVMYLFNALDRSNLGNARTDTLEEDLGMSGNQYLVRGWLFAPGNPSLTRIAHPDVLLCDFLWLRLARQHAYQEDRASYHVTLNDGWVVSRSQKNAKTITHGTTGGPPPSYRLLRTTGRDFWHAGSSWVSSRQASWLVCYSHSGNSLSNELQALFTFSPPSTNATSLRFVSASSMVQQQLQVPSAASSPLECFRWTTTSPVGNGSS